VKIFTMGDAPKTPNRTGRLRRKQCALHKVLARTTGPYSGSVRQYLTQKRCKVVHTRSQWEALSVTTLSRATRKPAMVYTLRSLRQSHALSSRPKFCFTAPSPSCQVSAWTALPKPLCCLSVAYSMSVDSAIFTSFTVSVPVFLMTTSFALAHVVSSRAASRNSCPA
jgi:hypothetical protein